LVGRPAMPIAGEFSNSQQETNYHLIFLNSILGRPLSSEVVNLHAAHLAELDKSGMLVLAGSIPDRAGGLIVLRTASAAEARAIADGDPLVLGGYQTYELGTWLMSNRQNGYHPNIPPEPHK
jgi:uncharacterized protein YciI